MTNKDEYRARLNAMQFQVTQQGGTERPFSGEYWNHHEEGAYKCVCCGAVLFGSDAKYDSGSGWPSFWRPLEGAPIEEKTDISHGMERTEVKCHECGAHLGHLFDDGPRPTGMRYCINSAALHFEGAGAPEK